MNLATSQRLFESYLSPILKTAYGTAFYLTRNRDDAEDLVQEAAVRAFSAFGTFQPGSNFKAWFLKILTNVFLNQCRRNRRQPDLIYWDGAADAYLSDMVNDPALRSNEDDPGKKYLKKLTEEQIAEAFGRLPEEFRVVCALYFMDELSYQEIADMVDCPIGTVRSRIHRGRKALQIQLQSIAEERGMRLAPALA